MASAETARRISQGAGGQPVPTQLLSHGHDSILGKWNKKEIYTFYGPDQGQRVMIGSSLIVPGSSFDSKKRREKRCLTDVGCGSLVPDIF